MITLEDAMEIVSAAQRKAAALGQPMNIAVADIGGNLIAHVRMDGAWIGSVDIAINKALTARAFDISTKDLATQSQPGAQFFGIHTSNGGRAGGIPLKRGGRVVGAIGVSGGSGEQDQAVEKIQDLTCLTDILPTGYHGCINAGVTTGSTVLISGAGPVGLAAAAAAQLLGAAVSVSDFNKERLAQAASFGCETINLSQGGTISEQLDQIIGVPEVDCAVDCVGFEAKERGGAEQPAVVLNQLMSATRAAGSLGRPCSASTDHAAPPRCT